ncbi:MAG TPA: BBP7 family outer membrane beta-barrel protein, partial [Gemmataceae bacterium]|nr:BBP7 family outer membrane beta-barrel protein [Gemmataceae bacterium]
NACDPCACTCTQPDRVWVDLEFLYWATQGVVPPPVVTTGPSTAAPGVAGVIGQPTTRPLFGGDRTLNQFRPGFRAEAGYWFDPSAVWGVSGRLYFLGAVSERFLGAGNGTNVVNVPQFVTVGGVPTQIPLYVGFPGQTIGTVSASTHSNFIGGDLNLRRGLGADRPVRFDLLGGYRFLHLGDNELTSFDVVSATVPAALSPRLVGEDSIRTRNQFHGGQLGFAAYGRHGPFSLELQTTVALGVSVTELDDNRFRVFGGGAAGLPAGLVGFGPAAVVGGGAVPFAVNQGGQVNFFAVVPEVGVKLGWHPWEHVSVTCGYDFLYWSRVRRAQDLAGSPPGGSTDFWVQGINVGLDFRY